MKQIVMKRHALTLALICLFCSSIWSQKKYEMVIEKTDGTETVIPTSDIVRTFFREIANQDKPNKEFSLIGTWCYGSSEEDAFGDMNDIEGWVFRDNGTCTYFAIYNQGKSKEKFESTYTFDNQILTITRIAAYDWKNNEWQQRSFKGDKHSYNVTISGNCMTWTGDDNETLYTREGLSIDLGTGHSPDKPDTPDSPDTPSVSDPEGTISIECKRNTCLHLFDEAGNAIYCDKYIFDITDPLVDVMDCGEVNGLAEITIPAVTWSAWKKEAAQRVGHGYIFRYTGASTNIIKYAIVYIVKQNAADPMSYTIKYLTPFVLPDTDVIPTGTYGEKNRQEDNYFIFSVNGSYISWKHFVNEKEEQYSTVESDIITNIDHIYVAHGDNIILSSFKGAANLNYKREGNEVTIGSKTYVKLAQVVENHH